MVVAVKALACELPHESGLPISKFSIPDLKREVISRGLVASIGETTLWRWLTEDAIRPWCHRSWIFPRDPHFEEKAGVVLDLYARCWHGEPLGGDDFVISADEKTSIQARQRRHPILAPAPGRPIRVEHEYKRFGAWIYLAAWDVGQAKLFGHCEQKNGIAAFERLVAQVMNQEPYRSAHRVFWIVDNCTSHRGQPCADRLKAKWPNTVVVHTPVHASWLNQVEIYFSVLQRKLLSLNHFESLADLEKSILAFQSYYAQIAKPFQWKYTRDDLRRLLDRLSLRRAA